MNVMGRLMQIQKNEKLITFIPNLETSEAVTISDINQPECNEQQHKLQ